MKEIKYFEVRDAATFIPVMAIRITVTDSDRDYLLRRAGYGIGDPYVLVIKLEYPDVQYDAYKWRSVRPMRFIHTYIERHWDLLSDGDVLDYEYLNGISKRPKQSERFTTGPCVGLDELSGEVQAPREETAGEDEGDEQAEAKRVMSNESSDR